MHNKGEKMTPNAFIFGPFLLLKALIFSPSHIVQVKVFLEFLHENCKSETLQNFKVVTKTEN